MFGEVLISMVSYRIGELARSRQCDPIDVNCHEQWFRDQLVIALVGIDAPLGREHETINLPILRGVIQSGRSTQDVDGVVVTTEKAVRTKTKDLLTSVTLDPVRERNLKPPSRLAFDRD
jgi:hypothetical protein